MIEEKEELQGQLIASGQVIASMVSTKGDKGDPGEPGSPGVPGQDGFSPIASISKIGKVATITITDSQGTTTAEIRDGEDGSGSGDMLKSTYDTDNNGIVDNAEKVNNHTVLSDVPANAVFTDTTYTAGTNVSISAQNVISATDTTYTAGTGIDITNGVISNTQTSAEWGNISGTLSNQTDLKNELDKKQDLTPTRLTDTSIGTNSNPYILDTMASGYYFIETPSGVSRKYFKLTNSASGSTVINISTAGDGFGFYLYIPETIDTPNLSNGDVVCYFNRISISSTGSTLGGLICYVYDSTESSKIGLDKLKSYNRSFGTTITASTQTWNGVKTFNDVPVCATAPTNNSDLANKKYIDDGLSAKQDTLVSGTNIKTINGTSVLGSGNLDVGASIPVQDTAPQNPEEDDLWIDTANDNTLKYYDGASWNSVSDTITGDTLPVGSIVPYGSTTAPTNWLVCDGSTVSRTTYAELFSVIGTSFGAGDGSTTFNLPNLKGKVPVGQDSTQTEFDTIGETGGEKTHTLIQNEMPSHYHTAGTFDNYTLDNTSVTTGVGVQSVIIDINSSSSSTRIKTNTAGSNQAHNNLQPYQIVNYIIKATQSAGLVANVSNTRSDSTEDTYSCDFANGTILYQSNNGTNQTINLSDNLTNYKRFDVYCSKGPATSSVCSFWQTTGKFTIFANSWAGNPFLQTVYQEYEITNATTLTPANGGYINYSNGNITQGAEYELKIYKIIGYKY